MALTATNTPGGVQTLPSPRQTLLDSYNMEHATTLRVVRAYPTDKLELKPHGKCKSARELAWVFVIEQRMMETALTTGFDFSKGMPAMPTAPATMDAIITALEAGHTRVATLIADMNEDRLGETVSFFTGPKALGQVPLGNVLWMMIHDQIHHRGQLSVYLRMADGKVPSIYGPTLDEPWN